MALLKGIHLSSRHWEDQLDPKSVPVKSRYLFNEVSVDFFRSILIRVVPRYINLVPLWDEVFFVFKKTKEEFIMQERLEELQKEALQKIEAAVDLKELNDIRVA